MADLDDLVSRAKCGDRAAMNALLTALRPRLLAATRKIARHMSDAEDAVQEASVRIATNLARYRNRSAFTTWATSIAINAAIDLHRRQVVRAPERFWQEFHAATEPAAETTPETELICAQATHELRQAIARLPEPQREAIRLHDLEGRPHTEVAAALGIPVGTALTRVFYGRRGLARELSL